MLRSIPKVMVLAFVCALVAIFTGSTAVFLILAGMGALIHESSPLLSAYTTFGFGLLFMSIPCGAYSLILSVVICCLPRARKNRKRIVLIVASALGFIAPVTIYGIGLLESMSHAVAFLAISSLIALFVTSAVLGALAALQCEKFMKEGGPE